jgi:hypothetical protein
MKVGHFSNQGIFNYGIPNIYKTTSNIEVVFLYNLIKETYKWDGNIKSQKRIDMRYKLLLIVFAYINNNKIKDIAKFLQYKDHTSISNLLVNTRPGLILSTDYIFLEADFCLTLQKLKNGYK